MRIHEYLKEGAISLDLKSDTKEKAIREIAGPLKMENNIVDFDTFLSEVFDREKLTTTGIGDEIAIPHARTDAVKDFVIAFGRSKEGINFDSVDGKPVRFIFLIGTPKKEKLGGYLKLLARLTRLLKKDDFKQLLLTALTPKDILSAFKSV